MKQMYSSGRNNCFIPFEVGSWCLKLKLDIEVEVWSESMKLKIQIENWSWSFQLKSQEGRELNLRHSDKP